MKNLIKKLEEISAEQLHNQKQARATKYNSENVEVLGNLEAAMKNLEDTKNRIGKLLEYMNYGPSNIQGLPDPARKMAIKVIKIKMEELNEMIRWTGKFFEVIQTGNWSL